MSPLGRSCWSLADAVDFDEDGGSLLIGAETIDYASADLDADTIELRTPVGSDYAEAEPVIVLPESRERQAMVRLDEDGEAIEARVPLALFAQLTEGVRGDDGESVAVELVDYEWVITDVLGTVEHDGSPVVFTQDGFTLTSGGAESVELAHEPMPDSEHVYWQGVYQPADAWAREGRTITLSATPTPAEAGDRIVVEYAHQIEGLTERPPVEPLQSFDDIVLGNAPLVYLTMNELSGTAAVDASGNGHPATHGAGATAGSAPLTPDGIASTSYSGASSAYSEIPAGAWMDHDQWTALCVFNVDVLPSTSGGQLVTRDTGDPFSSRLWNLGVGQAGNVVAYARNSAGGWATGSPDGSVVVGSTHFAAITFDGSILRLYLDGDEYPGSFSAPGGTFPVGTGLRMRIGANDVGTSLYQGRLAKVAFFDRVLPGSALAALSSATQPAS